MKQNKTFTSKVLEICDNGDAIVELPPELCDELGWKEGTVLNLEAKNGQIFISEKKDVSSSK
mgnify:CR=1 FL=1